MKVLFETSFEVCNKVGGIYTVVSSKVPAISKYYNRHILIGPWFRDRPAEEFIQSTPEEVPPEIQYVFNELFKKNIYCTYGRWDIPGKPEVILIDYHTFAQEGNKNYLKEKYWKYFGIDSLGTSWDFDEPLCFSTAAGMLIELFYTKNEKLYNSYIAQFHEWMCGFGGLYLKAIGREDHGVAVKTVFTTHATMLGRSLVSKGIDLDKLPSDFDPMRSAKEIGIIEKHTTEYACANELDAFTTVSKLTQKEATTFFGTKPSLTYNGIYMDRFKKGKALMHQHHTTRLKFLSLLDELFPEEKGTFKDSFLIYTSGRPEFHNKGYDVLLEALSKWNLKKNIVCFFLVPWMHYEKKESFVGSISTHYLHDESHHPIVEYAKQLGLDNKGKVKIILYPCYLGSAEDNIVNLPYYDAITAFDLGVFVSSYEPWGYTPLESIALGVPAITTDVTGFGDYIGVKKMQGVEVIRHDAKIVNSLLTIFKKYAKKNEFQKTEISLKSQETAQKFDWNVFIKNYLKVYGNQSK